MKNSEGKVLRQTAVVVGRSRVRIDTDMDERAACRIRQFRMEDINEVLEIEKHAFPKTAYPKEVFLHYAKTLRDHFIVIEAGTDVVGYIIFETGGHIISTAVKTDFRRRGYGKMLFMHALEAAKENLWLEVRSKNPGAIEFYKRLGMKIVGRIPHYYGIDDALIMELSSKPSSPDDQFPTK